MGVTPMRALAPERERGPVIRRPASPLRVPEAPVADRVTPTAAPPRPAWLRPTEPAPPRGGPDRMDASADAPEGRRLDGSHGVADQGDAVREGDAAAPREAGAEVVAAGTGAAQEGGDGLAAARVEMVPEPETGPVTLPTASLGLPPTSVAFDAPLRLELRPERPAQERTPELDRHADIFAAAATAAARLHAELIRLAAREADAARDGEARRATLRQRDLDGALGLLGTELAEARGVLASGEAECHALIAAASREARASIRGAARRANAALTAKATEVARDTGEGGTERRRADAVATGADGRIAELRRIGIQAADALRALSTTPTAAYPEAGEALTSAKNEAIVERLPPRATERERVMRSGTTGMANNLTPTVERLRTDITNAFAPFRQMEQTLTVTAPAAVTRTRDAALEQVRSTATSLTAAVTAGRARSEAALVRQHDAARRQAAEGGRRRAAAERDNAARQAGGQIQAATGLAAAQGAALRALVARLRPEQRRPAPEFATLVVRSAEGLRERLAETAATAAPRIARSGAERRAAQDAAAQDASARIAGSVGEQAAQILGAAQETGDALRRQVEDGTTSFRTVARPVTRSIGGYIEPIRRSYATQLADLRTRITNLGTEITTILNEGRGTAAGAAADSAAPPAPPAAPIEGGARSAREFVERARGVAQDARTEAEIAAFAGRVGTAVRSDVNTRTTSIMNGLNDWIGPDVEMVMSGLRGLTRRRAQAVIARYAERPGGNLRATIRRRFLDNFSFPGTIRHNINAAMNYLNGDAERGALSEMQAAVNMWNDEARVERVQRSLTPAQATALRGMPGAEAILNDIRDDLDGADRQVFEALRAATPESIGRANAIRLAGEVDRGRAQRGYRAADRTADAIAAAARNAGSDRLSGMSDLPELETEAERTARREAVWRSTVTGFASVRPLPREPGAAGATGPPTLEQGQAALIAAATGERDYIVQTHAGGPHGGGRYEVVREGVDAHHARQITAIVRHGPESAEASAAALVVEMNRPGGRPDPARLDAATWDAALNPALAGNTPEARRRRDEALARRDRVFALYEDYTRGPHATGPPRSPEMVRRELQAEVRGRFGQEDPAGAYAASTLEDARATTDRSRADAAVAAFNYAVEGTGTRVDVLRRQFGRMTREQVDQAVTAYNAAHPNGPSLYARLGIHGEGNWVVSELSGDERLEIERASLGVPQNDMERAELAALTARQQIRESGVLGRFLAGDEYGYLKEDYASLLSGMGVSEGSFDRRGRLIRARDPATGAMLPVGHFNAAGDFVPPREGSREEFEVAMGLAKLSAESYSLATDRIASAVTMALMVTAAIVTTALTGGAAASIWIPVLVTAGAGLAGMGMSALIKGGRYGHEEAARDLVMTVVQAATAGLGAAATTALRGGAPALRAAAGSMRVSETAMETAMAAGGRTGMRAALTLGEEAVIGGASNMVNGMAGAMMDPTNWHGGEYGTEVGHAALRSFFSGVIGAGAMRPFAGAAGSSSALVRRGGRAIGQGFAGSATRATEIGYEHGRGRHRASTAATVSDILGAGAQGFVQGLGEARAEDAARLRAARRAAAGRAADAAEPPAPAPVARPAAEPAAEPAVARPGPVPRVGDADDAPKLVTRRPPPSPEEEPTVITRRPPPLPEEEPTVITRRPPPSPEEEPTVITRRPPPSPEEEPTVIMRRPPPSPEEEPTLVTRRPPPSPEEEPTVIMRRPPPSPEEEPTLVTRRPPPSPDEEPTVITRRPAPPEEVELVRLPEMTVMMDPNPHDLNAAIANYAAMIRDDPTREAAIYRNPVTGEYVVVQGVENTVFVGRNAAGQSEAPVGSGYAQRWKELLDHDIGHWVLEEHFHPPDPRNPQQTGFGRRIPSGAHGDLGVVAFDSAQSGGGPRSSRITYVHEGKWGYTDFGFDPNSRTARYWVEIDNPFTGRRERYDFASTAAYDAWANRAAGIPLPPSSPVGGTTPSHPVVPRSDAPLGPTSAGAIVVPARPPAPAPSPRPARPPPTVAEEATTARAVEAARDARPPGRGRDIGITVRDSDDTILVSLPRPDGGADARTHVRARIVVEPGAPGDAPVRFERNPPGGTIREADGSYVIRIRADADPAEIAPGLAGGFARMQRAEEARIRRGDNELPPEGPPALAPGAPLDRPLSIGDRARLAALRARMVHLDARERALQADQREANLPPAESAARQAEIDALRAAARGAVRDLGLADDAEVLPRLARLLDDPGMDADGLRLLRRAVEDANAGADPVLHLPDGPAVAPRGPATPAETYRAEQRLLRLRRSVVDDAVRRLATTHPDAADTVRHLLDLAPEPVRAALTAETPAARRAAVAALRNALREAGMPPAAVQAELRRLGSLWREAAVARAVGHATGYAANRAAIGRLSEPLRGWARDHPTIAHLAGADPAHLRHRFQRFLTKDEYAAVRNSPDAFEGYLQRHEEAMLRPAVAEAEAARHLAALFDAFVLRGGPAGDRFGRGSHGPNDPGIDLVLVARTPPGVERPEGSRVPVILGDDKSLRNPDGSPVTVSSVSALVENLTRNLGVEAGAQRQALQAQERQGFEIARDHRDAVNQMEAAWRSLSALDAEPRWAGNPDRFSNPDYIRSVSRILVREQMLLVITSARGDAAALSRTLQEYGFILVP
ncbi:hypothetical protein [Falsiroseomonas sp.]|uniref:hypothetical protein n=1 Tax=Falsiroseomonas sp. TaxID=2870721 RepID=UPI0035676B39